VRDLRPTIPKLAKLAKRTVPFLEQSRALSSCFNEVVIPWSNDTIDGGSSYPHPAVGPVYKETAYGLVGIAGESRSGDANGQYIRVQGAGGVNTVQLPATETSPPQVGVLQQPLLGQMPTIESSAKPDFRPDVPCETQEPPDLSAGPPGAPPRTQTMQPPEAGASPDAEQSSGFDELNDTELAKLMSDAFPEGIGWGSATESNGSSGESQNGKGE
jgi:phospholipid/cholesterol/gamma-HCH transport system substrate-binding protein